MVSNLHCAAAHRVMAMLTNGGLEAVNHLGALAGGGPVQSGQDF